MKICMMLLYLLWSSVLGQTFRTDNFEFEFHNECGEGKVTCKKVRVFFSPIGIKLKLEALGRSIHSLCADGTTPCRFVGYELRSDGVRYIVYGFGVLSVMDDSGNELFQEQGFWEWTYLTHCLRVIQYAWHFSFHRLVSCLWWFGFVLW